MRADLTFYRVPRPYCLYLILVGCVVGLGLISLIYAVRLNVTALDIKVKVVRSSCLYF